MSNVPKIIRRRRPNKTIDFKGFSSYTGKEKQSPEGLMASAAVAAFVAMQLLLVVYEGFTPVYTGFAAIQLVGVGLGLALRRRPYTILSCVSPEAEAETDSKPKPKPHHRIIVGRVA